MTALLHTRRIARAVARGGVWAVGDAMLGKRKRVSLGELESIEAQIAAIVFRCAIEAGMLVLVDTSPEVIALKIAISVAAAVWRMNQARRLAA